MGKKKGCGGGGGGGGGPKRGGRRPQGQEIDHEMVFDEVDRFHNKQEKEREDYIGLNGNGDDDEEDSGEEEGVFDLDVGGDESSSEEEEEESDDEDDESSEDGEEQRSRKGGKLPRVEQSGLLSDEEEEDEDDEDDARKVRQWGKHKQQYYSADATDLEIGQDFADAEEEEAAAREVERARLEEVDEEDYFDVEEESDEDETMAARLAKGNGKGKGGKAPAALLGGALGLEQNGDVETATVARDLSRLSKAGKLQVLMTDAPELLALLEEFKEKVGELQERVEPLLPLVRRNGEAGAPKLTEEGVAYLEVKQQLLLNYCINLTYYLLLKAEGKPVRDHPVIGQLLELRAALEKLRPLDAKLKFHIDRLLRVAEMSPAALAGATKDPLAFRPNPDALVGKGAAAEQDEEGEEDEEDGGGDGDGVYRPPRLAAVPYEEEGEAGKRAKEEAKARRNLEKLRRSEILQTLTEQFSDKPELVALEGGAGGAASALARQRAEEEEERRRYEEERFVRLVTTKKEKKLRKAAEREATRLETIADIGDFHELEETLASLGKGSAAAAGIPSAAAAKAAAAAAAGSQKPGLSALQRAVNSLAQKEQSKKRRREKELAGDADVPYRDPDEIRVRRPAPDDDADAEGADAADLDALDGGRRKGKKGRKGRHGDGEGGDDGFAMEPPPEEDPYYDAVAAKRAAKKAEKAALYAVEPTYGAMEDQLDVAEGEKRGINYQILKNRGLTPYKSKLNRNPRVKKREAYRKAVIRRKGQVREVRASEAAAYGGEATGINARVVRVRGKK